MDCSTPGSSVHCLPEFARIQLNPVFHTFSHAVFCYNLWNKWPCPLPTCSVHLNLSKLRDSREGSLAQCSPRGHRVRHNLMTEQLFTHVRCSIKWCTCIVSLNSCSRCSHYTVTVSPGPVLCEPGTSAGSLCPQETGPSPVISVQFSSVTHLCPTLCDPMNCSTPVYPNSCPLHRWCHPTISSSVVPVSSCLQSFPASGSFQMRH